MAMSEERAVHKDELASLARGTIAANKVLIAIRRMELNNGYAPIIHRSHQCIGESLCDECLPNTRSALKNKISFGPEASECELDFLRS